MRAGCKAPRPLTCAVLSIGTELTRGELINSNAAWLGEQLTALGFEVRRQATVGDDPEQISSALLELSKGATIVVATGGLGPTSDDVTTASVAAALQVPLQRDPSLLASIRRRYESRGRTMVAANEKQADLPAGAEVVPNPMGTAPGFCVRFGDTRCFFLPGVPREMKLMFEQTIAPQISVLGQRNAHQLVYRTFGLPESEVQERLSGLETDFPGVTLGYRAHFPEIAVKVHARAESEREAEELARSASTSLRKRLGRVVYGSGSDTFPLVIGRELRNKRLTLAVAESCTGGLVGAMLTSVPGSSDYVLFDAVTYANSAKTKVLGVNTDMLRAYGAVSSEVAGAMAEGARRIADSDLAVSITGVAGPGGGTEEKPVGTVWFGLASRNEPTTTVHRHLQGDRHWVRTLSAYLALDMVRSFADEREITRV